MDTSYAEHFGFTQNEVDQMLKHYGLEQNQAAVRTWYDGYRFGETEVYNPWSVISYVNSCYKDKMHCSGPTGLTPVPTASSAHLWSARTSP